MNFSSQRFASKLNTKGLIAHDYDDSVVSFEEGKKNSTILEKFSLH